MKPGKAYSILKRLGAQPGDCLDDSNTFTLTNHDDRNLTDEESAEVIASHFSSISQEFPELSIESLPDRVKNLLAQPNSTPQVSEFEVYQKIISAKKGVN